MMLGRDLSGVEKMSGRESVKGARVTIYQDNPGNAIGKRSTVGYPSFLPLARSEGGGTQLSLSFVPQVIEAYMQGREWVGQLRSRQQDGAAPRMERGPIR